MLPLSSVADPHRQAPDLLDPEDDLVAGMQWTDARRAQRQRRGEARDRRDGGQSAGRQDGGQVKGGE